MLEKTTISFIRSWPYQLRLSISLDPTVWSDWFKVLYACIDILFKFVQLDRWSWRPSLKLTILPFSTPILDRETQSAIVSFSDCPIGLIYLSEKSFPYFSWLIITLPRPRLFWTWLRAPFRYFGLPIQGPCWVMVVNLNFRMAVGSKWPKTALKTPAGESWIDDGLILVSRPGVTK